MDILKQSLFATFALLLALGTSPDLTSAQNQPGVVSLGVQGGIAQSSFSGSGVESSTRSGFVGGAEFSYNINEVLTVDFDFLYAKKGGTEITADGGPNVSDAYNLEGDELTIDYVEFPVLFKLTAPIEAVKIRAMAGPSISFLTGAKENGNDTQQGLQSDVPVDDRFLLYDLAGVVGGEIALPLPGLQSGEVALDGRYSFGLRNVDQTQDFTLKTRTFSGSLIFRFPLE